MQKLNTSVLQCLHPDCHTLPTIQLDAVGNPTRSRFTAAQALVCADHVEYGIKLLREGYPKMTIERRDNPGWIRREQEKAMRAAEQDAATGTGETGERHPFQNADELAAYLNRRGAGTGRRK